MWWARAEQPFLAIWATARAWLSLTKHSCLTHWAAALLTEQLPPRTHLAHARQTVVRRGRFALFGYRPRPRGRFLSAVARRDAFVSDSRSAELHRRRGAEDGPAPARRRAGAVRRARALCRQGRRLPTQRSVEAKWTQGSAEALWPSFK